jgi:hypothetical protein
VDSAVFAKVMDRGGSEGITNEMWSYGVRKGGRNDTW